MAESFIIKQITWSDFGFNSPILLQDINGPCPLIALVNTVIMQYELEVQRAPDDPRLAEIAQFRSELLNKGSSVQLNELLVLVANLVIELAQYDSHTPDFVPQVLDLLPKLHHGLDVDPNLISGGFSDSELASQLFTKVFRLKFKHAWIVDEDIEVIRQVQTFDRLQDYLLASKSGSNSGFGLGSKARDTEAAERWLERTQSQTTNAGINLLLDSLEENELAILFRNNHFNTLIKGPQGKLYLLITASAFANKKDLIWQGFLSVNGNDDIFFTGSLFPILDDELANIELKQVDEDANMDLLRQLQEEEDLRMAHEMQERYKIRSKQREDNERAEEKGKKSKQVKPKQAKQNEGFLNKDNEDRKDKKKKPGCAIV